MPEERRQRTLTKHDLEDLKELLKTHQVCSLNLNPDVAKALNALTPEQIGILRRIMSIMGSAAGIIGGTILVAIVGVLIAIFTKGFWSTIASGIKIKTP